MDLQTVQSRRRLWQMLLSATSFSGLSLLYIFKFHKSLFSWITGWFQWCPTSAEILEQAERNILSYVKNPMELKFVTIPSNDLLKEESHIRTLTINKEAATKSLPLVLLHGFASGIGLWILNLDDLSNNRTIYALDILGFGRSSRPSLSRDAEQSENQLVESIEEWRKAMHLEKFILLGHSMGGFLATSYAIKYPKAVKHLILADPWGFPEQDVTRKIQIPTWVKMLGYVLRPFNPLAGLRAAGPWGPQLIQNLRSDIMGKYEHAVDDSSVVSDYIYHCNVQTPSGEAAFKSMMAHFGWAKRPILKRITELQNDISITFIYGARSWVDNISGFKTAELRKNVNVELIQGAGHHVYADNAKVFNDIVNKTCMNVDQTEYISEFPEETSSNDYINEHRTEVTQQSLSM